MGDPLAAGIAAALVVSAIGVWRSARQLAAAAAGRAVTFDVFLRAGAPPYPRRWRLGWLAVGEGVPSWKPRFSLWQHPIPLPASATVDRIRPLSGLVEAILTNPGCRVVVVDAGDAHLELGVLWAELVPTLRALESATGGGWRVPAALVEKLAREHDDDDKRD